MTPLPLTSGLLKRDILQAAAGVCGAASYEFELEVEQQEALLRHLNAMLAQWKAQRGVDLGYAFPVTGSLGSPDEPSGLPDDAAEAVWNALARRYAPEIGKSLSSEANANHKASLDLLFATYGGARPTMQLRRATPRGQGNRRWGLYGREYYIPDAIPD